MVYLFPDNAMFYIAPVSAVDENNDATSAGHSALVVEVMHTDQYSLVASNLLYANVQLPHANPLDQIIGGRLDRCLDFSDHLIDTLKNSKERLKASEPKFSPCNIHLTTTWCPLTEAFPVSH